MFAKIPFKKVRLLKNLTSRFAFASLSMLALIAALGVVTWLSLVDIGQSFEEIDSAGQRVEEAFLYEDAVREIQVFTQRVQNGRILSNSDVATELFSKFAERTETIAAVFEADGAEEAANDARAFQASLAHLVESVAIGRNNLIEGSLLAVTTLDAPSKTFDPLVAALRASGHADARTIEQSIRSILAETKNAVATLVAAPNSERVTISQERLSQLQDAIEAARTALSSSPREQQRTIKYFARDRDLLSSAVMQLSSAVSTFNDASSRLDRGVAKQLNRAEELVVSAENASRTAAETAQNIVADVDKTIIIFGGVATTFTLIGGLLFHFSSVVPLRRSLSMLSVVAEADNNAEPPQSRLDEVNGVASVIVLLRKQRADLVAASEARKATELREQDQRVAMLRELSEAFGSVVDGAVAGDFSRRISATFPDEELNSLADGVNSLLVSVSAGVEETRRVLEHVSQGDLRARMSGEFQGAFGELQHNVNVTMERLSEMITQIAATTKSVHSNADEIKKGADELAARAEQQASSLEETAATTEEMSASIKSNADSSRNADALATDASRRAGAGGQVVNSAVAAMKEIEESASKIADIIGVIDGIAFQTNLLALNAAVEAARAGDAGKGFAVVASEVRGLAQRSSEASRDIRQLIETSAGQVAHGVQFVSETGDALEGIVASIAHVEEAIKNITETSTEQASGVEEISSSVSNLDQMTQHNASMAEQSAANARSLVASANELQDLIAQFKADDTVDEEFSDATWHAIEEKSVHSSDHKSPAAQMT